MNPLYGFGVRAYGAAIRLAAPFIGKAKQWYDGRKNWVESLRNAIGKDESWVWFHCASLGEFEQGRPLMEAWRSLYPEDKILLTFYSPSGYTVRKNYPGADHVAYLPLDTRSNARTFLDVVRPRLVFFVKYDLWLNHLAEMRTREIEHHLIAALLDEKSRFLNGILKKDYAEALAGFRHIFTQNEATSHLLEKIVGPEKLTVAGDPRFDRVVTLPEQFREIAEIESWKGNERCIVVGSTHARDEAILLPVLERWTEQGFRWIIAPHEIEQERIDRLCEQQKNMVQYSHLTEDSEAKILWIDNVGMLGRLYHYAEVAYVGGGFDGTLHNTQEPAAYGNPVLFGPNTGTFIEAEDMLRMGTARIVRNEEELNAALEVWLHDEPLLEQVRAKNRRYIQNMAGATRIILSHFPKTKQFQ